MINNTYPNSISAYLNSTLQPFITQYAAFLSFAVSCAVTVAKRQLAIFGSHCCHFPVMAVTL